MIMTKTITTVLTSSYTKHYSLINLSNCYTINDHNIKHKMMQLRLVDHHKRNCLLCELQLPLNRGWTLKQKGQTSNPH